VPLDIDVLVPARYILPFTAIALRSEASRGLVNNTGMKVQPHNKALEGYPPRLPE